MLAHSSDCHAKSESSCIDNFESSINYENGNSNEMIKVVINQPQEKDAEMPVSNLVSCKHSFMNHHINNFTDLSNQLYNNLLEQVQSINGLTA